MCVCHEYCCYFYHNVAFKSDVFVSLVHKCINTLFLEHGIKAIVLLSIAFGPNKMISWLQCMQYYQQEKIKLCALTLWFKIIDDVNFVIWLWNLIFWSHWNIGSVILLDLRAINWGKCWINRCLYLTFWTYLVCLTVTGLTFVKVISLNLLFWYCIYSLISFLILSTVIADILIFSF